PTRDADDLGGQAEAALDQAADRLVHAGDRLRREPVEDDQPVGPGPPFRDSAGGDQAVFGADDRRGDGLDVVGVVQLAGHDDAFAVPAGDDDLPAGDKTLVAGREPLAGRPVADWERGPVRLQVAQVARRHPGRRDLQLPDPALRKDGTVRGDDPYGRPRRRRTDRHQAQYAGRLGA